MRIHGVSPDITKEELEEILGHPIKVLNMYSEFTSRRKHRPNSVMTFEGAEADMVVLERHGILAALLK